MKPKKKWSEMTTAELEAATADLDQPFAFERVTPLNAQDRKKHAEARKLGKRKGKGKLSPVSVVIDRATLDETDELASQLHVTRSYLFNRGLRALLALARG